MSSDRLVLIAESDARIRLALLASSLAAGAPMVEPSRPQPPTITVKPEEPAFRKPKGGASPQCPSCRRNVSVKHSPDRKAICANPNCERFLKGVAE